MAYLALHWGRFGCVFFLFGFGYNKEISKTSRSAERVESEEWGNDEYLGDDYDYMQLVGIVIEGSLKPAEHPKPPRVFGVISEEISHEATKSRRRTQRGAAAIKENERIATNYTNFHELKTTKLPESNSCEFV